MDIEEDHAIIATQISLKIQYYNNNSYYYFSYECLKNPFAQEHDKKKEVHANLLWVCDTIEKFFDST